MRVRARLIGLGLVVPAWSGAVVVLAAQVAPGARPGMEEPCATPSLHAGPSPMAKDLPPDLRADTIFETYKAADQHVLERTFTTNLRFEQFRKDFRTRVEEQWLKEPRRPDRATFMLDVAIAAINKKYNFWLDFIEEGRRYLTDRPEPPGQNPALDAFEIAWHKTSVAVLSGMRRPDYVASCGVDWLKDRMAPEPLASGEARLVDPWIELARGYRDEAFTMVDADRLADFGAKAVEHYDAAAKYDSTRAEAADRKAWLLIRLGRPADALAALTTSDEHWTFDRTVLYWSRLFRGLAHQKLNQPDEAASAYRAALLLAPAAQTPKVALMSAEFQRNQPDAAYAEARAVRTDPESYDDPFWVYPFGDRRLLTERMDALRKAARQ